MKTHLNLLHSSLCCHIKILPHTYLSPSVSLEKEDDTEVVVLGVRPSTLSDSRRVFLLAGPLLTRVYAAKERRDIFSGLCRRRLISSYEMRYFPKIRARQSEMNELVRLGFYSILSNLNAESNPFPAFKAMKKEI